MQEIVVRINTCNDEEKFYISYGSVGIGKIHLKSNPPLNVEVKNNDGCKNITCTLFNELLLDANRNVSIELATGTYLIGKLIMPEFIINVQIIPELKEIFKNDIVRFEYDYIESVETIVMEKFNLSKNKTKKYNLKNNNLNQNNFNEFLFNMGVDNLYVNYETNEVFGDRGDPYIDQNEEVIELLFLGKLI